MRLGILCRDCELGALAPEIGKVVSRWVRLVTTELRERVHRCHAMCGSSIGTRRPA